MQRPTTNLRQQKRPDINIRSNFGTTNFSFISQIVYTFVAPAISLTRSVEGVWRVWRQSVGATGLQYIPQLNDGSAMFDVLSMWLCPRQEATYAYDFVGWFRLSEEVFHILIILITFHFIFSRFDCLILGIIPANNS